MDGKDDPPLMTVAEAAAALRVSRTTAYQLITSGRLRSIRVGDRCRRIPRAELHAYIARQSRDAA